MASGHTDFAGYVEAQGEHLGVPTTIALSVDGNVVIVWED